MEKRCSKCSATKPVSAFSACASGKFGVRGDCKDCCKAVARQHYLAHREARIASSTAWVQRNPERRRSYRAEHYARNSDAYKANAAEWYRNNPERSKRRREVYEATPTGKERCQAARRGWKKRNPDKALDDKHRRRSRLAGSNGSHTTAEWLELCDRFGWRCVRCREIRPLSRDHVVPISRGGNNRIANIQPLCVPCNCCKHAKTIDWRY